MFERITPVWRESAKTYLAAIVSGALHGVRAGVSPDGRHRRGRRRFGVSPATGRTSSKGRPEGPCHYRARGSAVRWTPGPYPRPLQGPGRPWRPYPPFFLPVSCSPLRSPVTSVVHEQIVLRLTGRAWPPSEAAARGVRSEIWGGTQPFPRRGRIHGPTIGSPGVVFNHAGALTGQDLNPATMHRVLTRPLLPPAYLGRSVCSGGRLQRSVTTAGDLVVRRPVLLGAVGDVRRAVPSPRPSPPVAPT